jgi:hypothetical protein
VVFQLIIGGNVLAALIHPVFLLTVLYALLSDGWISADDGIVAALSISLFSASVAIGYFGSIALGWIGLARHGLTTTTWVLLLTPLHWLMLSCAGWRALTQLIRAPYHWEKTEHGLARTSRQTRHRRHIHIRLARLERHLSRIMALEPAVARYRSLRHRARRLTSAMMPAQK